MRASAVNHQKGWTDEGVEVYRGAFRYALRQVDAAHRRRWPADRGSEATFYIGTKNVAHLTASCARSEGISGSLLILSKVVLIEVKHFDLPLDPDTDVVSHHQLK